MRILSFKNWKVNTLRSKNIQTEQNKLSKTNTFFSRFEGTKGEKNPNISHLIHEQGQNPWFSRFWIGDRLLFPQIAILKLKSKQNEFFNNYWSWYINKDQNFQCMSLKIYLSLFKFLIGSYFEKATRIWRNLSFFEVNFKKKSDVVISLRLPLDSK